MSKNEIMLIEPVNKTVIIKINTWILDKVAFENKATLKFDN